MFHVGVLVLGAYFTLLSLWSLTHTTARYYVARRAQADFTPSLTPPCPCCPTSRQPVEGLLKMAMSAVLCLGEFSLDWGYPGDSAWLSRHELGTVYVFLLLSGATDVLARWGARTFYQRLDYAGTGLFFLALAVVLQTRAGISLQPVSALLSLASYAAAASAVTAAVEGVGVGVGVGVGGGGGGGGGGQGEGGGWVLAPVTRGFLLLLQGAWWLHGGVVMGMGVGMGGVWGSGGEREGGEGEGEGERERDDSLSTPSSDDPEDELHRAVVLASLLFSLHAGLSLLVVLCLWLLVGRLVERRGGCWGLGAEAGGAHSSNDVFLENRVRFNYHVLSRLDSESE